MLRINFSCDCGAKGEVKDLKNIIGFCPECHRHHGEVEYYTIMTTKEFLDTLANMTEDDIAEYACAINICAADLAYREKKEG